LTDTRDSDVKALAALKEAHAKVGDALSELGVQHNRASALVQLLVILGRLIKALKKVIDPD